MNEQANIMCPASLCDLCAHVLRVACILPHVLHMCMCACVWCMCVTEWVAVIGPLQNDTNCVGSCNYHNVPRHSGSQRSFKSTLHSEFNEKTARKKRTKAEKRSVGCLDHLDILKGTETGDEERVGIFFFSEITLTCKTRTEGVALVPTTPHPANQTQRAAAHRGPGAGPSSTTRGIFFSVSLATSVTAAQDPCGPLHSFIPTPRPASTQNHRGGGMKSS